MIAHGIAKISLRGLFIGLVTGPGIFSCKEKPYDTIRDYIDQIKVVDTHEHQGFPWKTAHNCFDIGMYMYTDLVSAGMPVITDSAGQTWNTEAYWDHVSPYLKYVRNTSYHAQFIKNLRIMYDLKSDTLTRQEFLRISAEIDSNYKNYAAWLDAGLSKLNIGFMLVDRVWDPFNPVMDHEKFGYVFRFDKLVTDVGKDARERMIESDPLVKLLKPGTSLNSLDEYLAFIDDVIDATRNNNVIALKMGLAYHRSLNFKEISYDRAKTLYDDKALSGGEKEDLQDYLVYYIAEKAGKMNLAIQIHTGYLHGNSATLDNGRPMALLPLFRKFPETKFVIFHGAYPWTSEFIAIGKSYPNVFLDIVWLPQISRTKAISVLHEILDCVPYNKICWGGDVGKIDETAGSLELGKEIVATVLSERIEKGWLSEELAVDIASSIFRDNACKIYNLKID